MGAPAFLTRLSRPGWFGLARFARSHAKIERGSYPPTFLTQRSPMNERGWSSRGFANHRLGCTGCQHSRLLALLRRLKPVHWGGGAHLRKMTKNRQKTYQKEHPAPQKLKFCNKKSVIFTQKDHPAPVKTQVLLEKMPKNRQKDDPKKEKPPFKI